MFESWSDSILQHRHARSMAWMINALLAAILIWTVVRLAMVIMAWVLQPAPNTSALIAAPSAQTPSTPVSSLHLFGAVLSDTTPVAAAQDIEVRGIFASTNPARGTAILKTDNGEEAVYRVGETLPDGRVIKAIYPDRIVIDRGGAREELRLPKNPLDASMPRSGNNNSASTLPLPGQTDVPVPIQSFIQSNIVTHGTAFDPVQQKDVLNAPPSQAALNAIQPVVEDGRFAGVRVSGLQAEWLQRAGLNASDVLVGVNGQTFSSLTDAQRAALSLADAQQATLSIRRNGRIETLTLKKP